MRTVWLLLFCCTVNWGFSQNFHLTHYTESDGLPSNQVYHMAADSLGYLWLATRQGLSRFDGSRFQAYAQEVPSKHGKFLLAVPEGLLLGHDAGISLIIPGVDSAEIRLFQAASIDPQDSALYYPGMLLRQQSGALWISQSNGLITRIHQGITKHYRSPQKGVNTFFAEQESGKLFAVTSGGAVLRFEVTKDRFIQIAKVSSANTILLDKNEIWVGGQYLHQLTLNAAGTKVLRQITHRDLPAEVTTLAFGPSREMLAGIKDSGLFQLQKTNSGKPELRRLFSNNDPHRVNELPFRNVHHITLLNEQQLFICSDEGFGILQNRFFETVNGLPNGNVNAITHAPTNGIYVSFGDLYRIEPDRGSSKVTALSNSSHGNISTVVADGDYLWIGSAAGKLLKTDANGIPLKVLDFTKRGEGVYYLLPDSKRRLWVCQAPADKPIKGLACLLPDGTFKEYGKEDGIENRILAIQESSQGRIYACGIGKETYLYRYLPEEDRFLNISLPFDFYISPNFEVHDLTVDDQGIIWLATTDGLLRYDLDRIELISLGRLQAGTEIRAVQYMSDGSIWCSTDTEGIIRYDESGSIIIREESGLPSKVMAYRSMIRDNQEHLWVGTAEGVMYSFNSVPKPKRSRKPLLVSSQIEGVAQRVNKLKLYQDQSLVLRVNSPAYHGYRTFYQYQIDSLTWSPLNTITAFNFEQLQPGKHVVHIRAQQEGSFYPSMPLTIPVGVRLRWHQQSWVRWSVSLVILLPLFLLWFYKRKKYNRIIANLSKELDVNKVRIQRRDHALAKAKAEIEEEHRELRETMLSMNVLSSIISKVAPGTKWDQVMEELSVEIMRLPGVVAFEVAHLDHRYLNFEGYSDLVKGFTTARIPNDPKESLAAYALKINKPMLFENLRTAEADYLTSKSGNAKAHRSQAYQSAIAVPFRWQDKKALLLIYANQVAFFDRYNLKTLVILANYLEQITKS